MTPADHAEMLSLQERLAYSAARSDIECYCITVTGEPGCWYDTRLVLDDGRETVAIATRYLELRDLFTMIGILAVPVAIGLALLRRSR